MVKCLKNGAYIPEKLENLLNERARFFIHNKNNFMIDEQRQTIYMSSIFDWYHSDFIGWFYKNKKIKEPHLLDYIKLYYDGQINEQLYSLDIEFIDYDRRLNEKI